METFLTIAPGSDFPVQNLPYGVFTTRENTQQRVGVAIGEFVLDMAVLESAGLLALPERDVFDSRSLNRFMALGKPVWDSTRQRLQHLLDTHDATLRDDSALLSRSLHPMVDVTLYLPVEIGDYTDFYSSRDHAANVGKMFRGGENALLPNWLHVPVGYHGRASSVVVSGTPIKRPVGQVLPAGADAPKFSHSQRLDFELEMGFIIGSGNALGQPASVDDAAEHIFGMVIVNDWSARDIQSWEYRPLGPFLAKNFATSISPWVVPMAALEPFQIEPPVQHPTPLHYLRGVHNPAYDIELEVLLQTPHMSEPQTIVRSNTKHLYWTMQQQLTHHTITGCNMRTGDLLASGTISGPSKESWGSLLELTWQGENPLRLSSGEERTFLQDGDIVVMRARAIGAGYHIGFGEVRGTIIANDIEVSKEHLA